MKGFTCSTCGSNEGLWERKGNYYCKPCYDTLMRCIDIAYEQNRSPFSPHECHDFIKKWYEIRGIFLNEKKPVSNTESSRDKQTNLTG